MQIKSTSLSAIFCFINVISLAQITSNFEDDADGWLVSNSIDTTEPGYEKSDGGYIYSSDFSSGGVWYWLAPAKFLGNKAQAFTNHLEFDIRQEQFHAPTDAENGTFIENDIIISNGTTTIACDINPNPASDWKHYSIPLDDSYAWKITTSSGATATKEQIQAVLANITQLKIRGEYLNGNDIGGLDNVVLNGVSLPIKLAAFNVTIYNNEVVLKWTSTNEQNSNFFSIEYSKDGFTFAPIGKVKAAGNSSSIMPYQFNHSLLSGSTAFYRLKMVDKDDSYQYSSVINISIPTTSQLTINPNPAADVCFISGLQQSQRTTLQLTTATGKILAAKQTLSSSFALNISSYPAGLYFLRINSNGSNRLLRLLKQ